MLSLSNLLFGRSLRLLVCLLVLSSMVSLAGCSQILPSLLGGSGPKVAANTQAGKTNNQTVGTTNITEQKLVRPQARTINQTSDTSKVKSDKVEGVVFNEGIPAGWIIALVLWSIFLWQLPSPNEIGRWFRSFGKK